MKFIYWMDENIKGTDMFYESVQLSYKGHTHFKTTFGGVVSIFIRILIFLYGTLLFVKVVTKNNTTKSVTSIVKDLTKDSTKHYIGKGTFAFGVKLLGTFPERILDPTYFNLRITQGKYTRSQDGSGGFTGEEVDIPFEY